MTRQDIMNLENGDKVKFGDNDIVRFQYKDEAYMYVKTSSDHLNKIPIVEFIRCGKAI